MSSLAALSIIDTDLTKEVSVQNAEGLVGVDVYDAASDNETTGSV
jgi:hypothetical protein